MGSAAMSSKTHKLAKKYNYNANLVNNLNAQCHACYAKLKHC